MNFRKLLTYFAFGTAAVMPFATAQNPTILQGSYVSNVFGPSNFVLNPNAQTNIASVTTSSATVSRSTTTPLVATSEFNITTSTATGYADWSTRTFDAGMKNNNCEARFTYRGFTVGTTKAQLIQNSLVIAELTLVGDSTNPKIASINFPCGDLTYATTFRLQQSSASLTGTNEIGGIYVGLATNQANVAQAEFIGSIQWATTANCQWSTSSGTFGNFADDLDCDDNARTVEGNITDASSGLRPAFGATFKPGNYQVIVQGALGAVANGAVTNQEAYWRLYDGTTQYGPNTLIRVAGTTSNAGQSYIPTINFTFNVASTVSKTFDLQASVSASTLAAIDVRSPHNFKISVYRFPSSSELVVKPETQNVFGGVQYRGAGGGIGNSVHGGATAPTIYSTFSDAMWNKPAMLKGRAQLATTSSNDLGFSIPNLPVGNYEVIASGFMMPNNGAGAAAGSRVRCNFRIRETTTSTTVSQQTVQNYVVTAGAGTVDIRNYPNSFAGVFTNTSVGTRNFVLQAQKYTDSAGTAGSCEVWSDDTSNSLNTDITITLKPLDQPSNSALYVQGPVKAAATGTAVASGYVFEEIPGTAVGDFTYTLGTAANVSSITLQPGVYLLLGQIKLTMNTGSDASTDNAISISSTSNATDGESIIRETLPTSGGSNRYQQVTRLVRVTSATTYYLVGVYFSGSGTVRHINNTQTFFKAIRLN